MGRCWAISLCLDWPGPGELVRETINLVEDQTYWLQSNAHQTSCYYPLGHNGQLSPDNHRPLGSLETCGPKTGNQEINQHKKRVGAMFQTAAVMLWQDADYNHLLSWQKNCKLTFFNEDKC